MAAHKAEQAAEEARRKAEEEAAAEELRKTAEATKANRNVFAQMEKTATSPGRQGKDALVREIFEELDEDGSGFLEFGEVGNMLDRLGLRLDDDEVAKCVTEMEQDATRDGKVDFPEFLSWWKAKGSSRKKGSIAEKIAARKKAEQEAAQQEAEDIAREKEERSARAKEQAEARRAKLAAQKEEEAARVAAEEEEAAAEAAAREKEAAEKAAKWKETARRERCV